MWLWKTFEVTYFCFSPVSARRVEYWGIMILEMTDEALLDLYWGTAIESIMEENLITFRGSL